MSIESRYLGSCSLMLGLAASFFVLNASTAQAQAVPATGSARTELIEGGVKEIKVESLLTSSSTDPKWQVVVVMENKGEVSFRPAGTLEILDVRGNVIRSFDFPQFKVIRDHDQRFVFPVQMALAPGSYTLRARVGVGNAETQQVLTEIVVDRPSSTIVLAQADYPVPIFSGR